MILNVRLFPDPILSSRCAPLEKFQDNLFSVIKQMEETLYSVAGMALAAPQVGISSRVIIFNMMKIEGEEKTIVLINPTIKESSGEIRLEEGCLSLPNIYEDVARPEKVLVEGLDITQKKIFFRARDMFARVIQHEIDHLDGILLWDRLSEKKRNKLRNSFLKSN